MPKLKIKVEMSARHVHLSEKDLFLLFGKHYILQSAKKISQPGQFAAREKIIVKGSKGELSVRVVGPIRHKTQVELSITDCLKVGIKPVVRLSGMLNNTPGCLLIGPKGKCKISHGVIVAQRHLHLNTSEAKQLGLHHRQVISLSVSGQRSVVFNKVAVRARPGEDKMSFMLDTDEANAVGLHGGEVVTIV